MHKKIVCTGCPKGCEITAIIEEGCIKSVIGYACKKGLSHARNEALHPKRMLTTTVKVKHGDVLLLPVKTSKPIPKELLFVCMEKINACEAAAPINLNETVIADIMGTGADIIAGRSVLRV